MTRNGHASQRNKLRNLSIHRLITSLYLLPPADSSRSSPLPVSAGRSVGASVWRRSFVESHLLVCGVCFLKGVAALLEWHKEDWRANRGLGYKKGKARTHGQQDSEHSHRTVSSMESFTIAVAGDVMLGRMVNRIIQAQRPQYVWGDLLPLLREGDLFLVNLECALTSRTEPWHEGGYKPFHFRAEPSAVDVLRVGGVDFACVANNHIGDFGEQGLLETVRVLDKAVIAHAGAGKDLVTAREAAVLEAGGWRVAVISATDQERDWAAGETTPGLTT
jgi:Bacterial capsule synthesis protein PGA_cap